MADSGVREDGEWQPAFPGQRAPFTPGHELSVGKGRPLVHGAYSARVTEPLARELVEQVLTDATLEYLHQARYAATLWSWAMAQARVLQFVEYLAAQPIEAAVKAKGASSLDDQLRRWITTASNLASRLGLDPMSAARLQRDLGSAAASAKYAGLADWLEQGSAFVKRDLAVIDVTAEETDDQPAT